MPRKVNVEKAIKVLREVEVLQGQGSTIAEACRKVGVTENTFYRYKNCLLYTSPSPRDS